MSARGKVAIVGVELHVPGARSPTEFLSIMLRNEEMLQEVPAPGGEEGEWVTRRPILEGFDEFDPEHFGISPRDAVLLDPQHRLFLMACRSLLHIAGQDYRNSPRIGVFASCDENQYDRTVLSSSEPEAVAPYERFIASDKDFLATRVAYLLGLTGPSLSVQTACSSSLVAAHLAVQALLSGDCNACIAGGVALQVPQGAPYRYVKDMIYSPDGRCRPFDAAANGTNLGSGVGVLLLKRLEDAVQENDRILAVISGSAVNNDGRRKLSYTSPSPSGQQEALVAALTRSGIQAETLRFVETHGTATRLGDPVEFSALRAAIAGFTTKTEFCALTGAKANFGHLSNAAGAVGLIKAALCLDAGVVPPMTNFEAPSPYIRLSGSPFRVLNEAERMPGGPGSAIVSSFGIGGTNACMVLERFEAGPEEGVRAGQDLLLPLSDDKEGALARNLDGLREAIGSAPQQCASLSAMSFRLRSLGECRGGLVVQKGVVTAQVAPSRPGRTKPRICFVLPGQGTQQHGALRSIYARNATFRSAFDRCDFLFARGLPVRISDVIWSVQPDKAALIDDPLYVQPVLFSLQYALVEALAAFGIRPDLLVGHSLGEIVALALSEVITLDDATRLVLARARCMASGPEGLMVMTSGIDADRASSLLRPGVYVAAVNGPKQVVFAGAPDPMQEFEQALQTAGLRTSRLRNRRPFHTPLMAGCLSELGELGATLRPRPATAPIVTTVTGQLLALQAPGDMGDYLLTQATEPVLFAQALVEATAQGADLFLEIGDTFLCHHLLASGGRALPLFERSEADEYSRFLAGVLRLWSMGAEPDLTSLQPTGRPLNFLPSYRFSCRRVWPADSVPLAVSYQRAPSAKRIEVAAADVVNVFRRVLSVEDVDSDADFFDLGGHSLLAFSFCQEFNASTGAELSVSDLFSMRTPRQIAGHLSRRAG